MVKQRELDFIIKNWEHFATVPSFSVSPNCFNKEFTLKELSIVMLPDKYKAKKVIKKDNKVMKKLIDDTNLPDIEKEVIDIKCKICGKPLTDSESIKRGCGKGCYLKSLNNKSKNKRLIED